MISIQKRIDGWVVMGNTVEELLIGAQAIERLPGGTAATNYPRIPPPPPDEEVMVDESGQPLSILQKYGLRKSRLVQLREFLLKNGPMARGEIIERSNIPAGTVNTTLNNKNFKQLEDGRWTGEKPE